MSDGFCEKRCFYRNGIGYCYRDGQGCHYLPIDFLHQHLHLRLTQVHELYDQEHGGGRGNGGNGTNPTLEGSNTIAGKCRCGVGDGMESGTDPSMEGRD